MHSLGQKLLIATVSGGVTALLAWIVLESQSTVDADTVELVDNTLEFSEVLRQRAAEVAPTAEPLAGEPEPRSSSSEAPHSPPTSPLASEPAPYPPPLVREALTLKQAQKIYAVLRRRGPIQFRPSAHLWTTPSQSGARPFEEHASGGWSFKTNSLGIRKDVEVRAEAPDLRVLVTGDSHTAGVVPNSESYANVLEVLLSKADSTRSFEVLNAGVGGTSMYHYLGVLEYLQPELRPQVLVVGVYGGNDFQGLMALYRFYNRRPPPRFEPHGGPALRTLPARGPVGQMLGQTAYFLDNPEDVELALGAMDSITVELERRCREDGIDLIFVYIPPVNSAQPERYEHLLEEPLAALDITLEELNRVDQYAAHWMNFLEQRGLTYIDMRPIFQASEEDCYWYSDLHINTHGHRLIAEALAAAMAPFDQARPAGRQSW